jgi:maleamate amidohydrolase
MQMTDEESELIGSLADSISAEELAIIRRSGFGRKIGFGARPAVLVIDPQKMVAGPRGGSNDEYPSACGERAYAAIAKLLPVLDAARAANVPVIYTRWELRRDQQDIGVYGRKRQFLDVDGWAIEGTSGVEFVDEVEPQPQDFVITKKKRSAFFGTSLISLLIDRSIDTLIVAGGSTSNCVRATVLDAWQYDYRTSVLRDCVFDRIDLCHRVSLFDLGRQSADIIDSSEALEYLKSLRAVTM